MNHETDQSSLLINLFRKVQGYFLNGLLVILPTALTIALVSFSFKIIKGWLKPIHILIHRFEPSWTPAFIHNFPHLEIIIVLLFIVCVGALFKTFFLSYTMHLFETIIGKIPLLNPLYGGIRQLVHAFTSTDKLAFHQAVLVEFPQPGNLSVGFVTSKVPPAITPNGATNLVAVFIATTPNPTTGFLIFVEYEKLFFTDLTRQEAMALIMSGGIVQPARHKDQGHKL